MTLLPEESQLVTSNDDKIILTTQRIQMIEKYWGSSYSIMIFLEDISSIEKRFKSNIIFFILFAIGILGGLFLYAQGNTPDKEVSNLFFVSGIVFLVLWLLSRKHVIKISSNGGRSLDFIISGMKRENVEDFIDKVSTAKGERIIRLYKL